MTRFITSELCDSFIGILGTFWVMNGKTGFVVNISLVIVWLSTHAVEAKILVLSA